MRAARSVERWSGGAQKQVFGWLSIGTAISGFIGPFAAGLLIDHAGATAGSTTGYRAAFLLMAIFSLLCWLLLRSMTDLPLTGVPKVSKNSITPASLAPCTKLRALLSPEWFHFHRVQLRKNAEQGLRIKVMRHPQPSAWAPRSDHHKRIRRT